MSTPTASFAYLFERFPSFVQTFVYREAAGMVRQKMAPLLVSIRRPDDPAELLEELDLDILYLPDTAELRATVKLPRLVRWRVPRAMREKDVNRLYEALWIAPHLRRAGVKHVHAHFGGMAARTAWWLRRACGFRYSFTGHANDIFCDTDFPVSNEMLVRDATLVVTETDYARRWLEEKYPHARGRVFRVFNGINLAEFPPREPAGPVPRIVSVGRYVEKKGFAVLIDACAELRKRGRIFECQIIGGGPLEEELQTRINRAGVGECVKLLGPRQQTEVRQLLARAQIFALACVPEAGGGADNLPTVIMEAMAVGLPIVSTRLAGIPEMITDGLDGLLAEPGDVPAFAAALDRLLGDPALAAQIATRAQLTAREKFAIENTTRELKHILMTKARVKAPPSL